MESEVVDTVVDISEANISFVSLLKSIGNHFIERLYKLSLDDDDTKDDDTVISTLDAVTRILDKGDLRAIDSLNLFKLLDFGLSRTALMRIAYFSVILDDKINRRQSGSSVPSKQPSVSSDIQNYEEDFESEYAESVSDGMSGSRTLEINGDDFGSPVKQGHQVPSQRSSGAAVINQRISGNELKRSTSEQSGNQRNGLNPNPPVIQRASTDLPRASSSDMDVGKRDPNKDWIRKGKWTIGEEIGSGSFGVVFQGLNPAGKLFAVKRLDVKGKSQKTLEDLESEIDLMRTLSHPNIVQYLGTKVDVEKGFVYIFQEWVPGGSVQGMLKKFGPFQFGVISSYTRQILLGLEYLHQHNIVHRDIKGGNVLVDDMGRVKLADFGASSQRAEFEETQATQTMQGTPFFMAPEVLSQSKGGRKGDIWAVGCTVYQMLTAEPPWSRNKLESIIQLYMLLSNRKEGPPPIDRIIPAVLMEFLILIFKNDPKQRPTATELLTHVFLSEDLLEDSLGGSIGPGGFNNRPYHENSLDSGGSSADLLRLKEARSDVRNSPAILKHKQVPIEFDNTLDAIDAQIRQRKSGNGRSGPDKNAQLGEDGRKFSDIPNNRYSGRESNLDNTQDDLFSTEGTIDQSAEYGVKDSKEFDGDDTAEYNDRFIFQPGDRVEAQYRGKDKWYPGVVTRTRNNGELYDIDYNDGEKETHVESRCVRVLRSGQQHRSQQSNQLSNIPARRGEDFMSPSSAGPVLPKSGIGSPPTAINPFGRRPNEMSPPSSNPINPFARKEEPNNSAPVNPFARQGPAVANPFAAASGRGRVDDVDSRGGNPRANSAMAAPGLGLMNFERPRDIRTAGNAEMGYGLGPEADHKSHLQYLKSSISNGSAMINGQKRRGSKGTEETVPSLQIQHSQSEVSLAPYRGPVPGAIAHGKNGNHFTQENGRNSEIEAKTTSGASDQSPRSNENTPRRLDPLNNRRPSSGKDSNISHNSEDTVLRTLPPVTAAVVSAKVSANEIWTCVKCKKTNPFVDGEDYCPHCASYRNPASYVSKPGITSAASSSNNSLLGEQWTCFKATCKKSNPFVDGVDYCPHCFTKRGAPGKSIAAAPVTQAVSTSPNTNIDEFWMCLNPKCNKRNQFEEGKDYCDHCAFKRGIVPGHTVYKKSG